MLVADRGSPDVTTATKRLPSGKMSASRPPPGPRPPYTLKGIATGFPTLKLGRVVIFSTKVPTVLYKKISLPSGDHCGRAPTPTRYLEPVAGNGSMKTR